MRLCSSSTGDGPRTHINRLAQLVSAFLYDVNLSSPDAREKLLAVHRRSFPLFWIRISPTVRLAKDNSR